MVLEKWGQEAWKTAEDDDEHSAQVPRSGSGEHHTWSWEESTEQGRGLGKWPSNFKVHENLMRIL